MELQDKIATMHNSQLDSFPISYLGIPLRPGKLHHDDWQRLLNKIDRRLASWKGNTLSRGGRLMLVNYVLSVMPFT